MRTQEAELGLKALDQARAAAEARADVLNAGLATALSRLSVLEGQVADSSRAAEEGVARLGALEEGAAATATAAGAALGAWENACATDAAEILRVQVMS